MLKILKSFAKQTFLGSLVRAARDRKAIRSWQAQGQPAPPPPAYKQAVVKRYAQEFHLKILVETGTYQGEMIAAQERNFSQIHSIELDEELSQKAKTKFAALPHIAVVQGDSSLKLAEILKNTRGPCLFWLDAHYSGDITARGSIDTPIVQELEIIFSRSNKEDVILIDDARCFNGTNDYPTLEKLQQFVLAAKPGAKFEIVNDIIRVQAGKSQ